MLKLKNYQQNTLDKLTAFLDEARLLDALQAFANEQDAQGYRSNYRSIKGLEDVPYLCLRLPTGGGKTLLGSYAIGDVADHYLEQDYPIVLWLVPTDIIRKQTIEVLGSAKKENRRVLDAHFNGQVHVYDITDFSHLRPQDLMDRVNIFVATFAAFRVKSKDGRKVYGTSESLAPCFRAIQPQEYFDRDEDGKSLHSFRNLLAYLRPLIIIDEAHNHSSKLSIEVLQRLRPSAIIELTATPADNSNVLYKVSASELKAEDMIKLPIHMEEHKSWEDAVTTAVQQQHHLEELAGYGSEPEYIRPIVLFQAENKNRDVTVSVIRDYLVNELQIPENQVAIATGGQRELDGIDLFDPQTPIRYIITVEALKEGWDCSFAYIFCSVAKVASSKDAEQLLGRVLRMPYAKRRVHPELNIAYAHIAVSSWHEAVSKIKDNLLGMGFEDEEVNDAVRYQQTKLEEVENSGNGTVPLENLTFHTDTAPYTASLNLVLQGFMQVKEDVNGGYNVTIQEATPQDLQELHDKASEVFSNPHDINELVHAVVKTSYVQQPKSPAERGEIFTVPQLCLDFGDGPELAEKESFLPGSWKLTDFSAALPGFQINAETHVYNIDIAGHKITESLQSTQQELNLGRSTQWEISTLVYWLTKKLKTEDIPYADVVEYLRRIIVNLQQQGAPLADLVRYRFILAKKLNEHIADCRNKAYQKGVEDVLFREVDAVSVTPDVSMAFKPGRYPAKSFYRGSVHFQKHFYSTIGSLDSEEETRCAQCIDANHHVVTWVRNIPRDVVNSFWLPTHTDKFYPDFVAKLDDGRVAVIEYKGGHLLSADDAQEKDNIGRIWAERSNGKCLFLMATARDAQGRDLPQQIESLLN